MEFSNRLLFYKTSNNSFQKSLSKTDFQNYFGKELSKKKLNSLIIIIIIIIIIIEMGSIIYFLLIRKIIIINFV